MPYIRLLAPRGEYKVGALLRVLGAGEERVVGAVDAGLAAYIVEGLGQANYVPDEEVEPSPVVAPIAQVEPAPTAPPVAEAVEKPRGRRGGKSEGAKG